MHTGAGIHGGVDCAPEHNTADILVFAGGAILQDQFPVLISQTPSTKSGIILHPAILFVACVFVAQVALVCI